MKFCCIDFQADTMKNKQSGINIRVVKFRTLSSIEKLFALFNIPKNKWQIREPMLGDTYRFYLTPGYEKDFMSCLTTSAIAFCPYCGKKLRDFYKSDEYVHEFEGIDFPDINPI